MGLEYIRGKIDRLHQKLARLMEELDTRYFSMSSLGGVNRHPLEFTIYAKLNDEIKYTIKEIEKLEKV